MRNDGQKSRGGQRGRLKYVNIKKTPAISLSFSKGSPEGEAMLPTDSGVSSDRMQRPGKFVNLLREKISEDAFAGNQMIRHRRERVSSAYEKTAKKKHL